MSNFLKIVNIFDILIEYRNGTESWLLLPLWQGDGRAVPSRMPAAGVLRKKHFHNGTDSRDLLPLRQGDGRATRAKLVGSASEVSRFITKSRRWR